MSETPREAVEATLALIAHGLADEGFALKPALAIKRKDGDFTDVISAQTSVWNRSGTQAWFGLTARLESGRFSKYRKQRWPDRPASVTRYDRFAASRQVKRPDTNLTCRWDALDPAKRPAIAATAVEIIRVDILPWLAAVRDPLAVLRGLEEGFLSGRGLAYACAWDLADEARAYLAEHAAANPALAETVARLKADPTDRKPGNAWDSVVLQAFELGLA
ncbi:MAG: hypothetical protein ACTHKE_05420 [Sphingomicrobium sp.]|jgi:hypothetical protein